MDKAKDYPPPGELADADDTLAWDRERHGRMADHATPDDTVRVTRAEPSPVRDAARFPDFEEFGRAPHRRETRYGGVDENPETD